MERTNRWGQPIGRSLDGFTARPRPRHRVHAGRFCRLEPLATAHAEALHAAYAEDDGRNWTYLPYGPFPSASEYEAFVEQTLGKDDPLFFAVCTGTDARPVGVASYLRIEPEMGVVEVGHLSYAPALQRTPAATEAMFLMMRHAFDDLGYRRYEWKCDALNAPSRAAAERLGFRYEGTFRNHVVMKGRNRDTAWFSITDAEWPALRRGFETWLAPENFDAEGRQRVRLSDLR